jgi:hypothetical protein
VVARGSVYAALGFAIARVGTHQLEREVRGVSAAAVTVELQGQPTAEPLTIALNDLAGVLEVTTTDLERGVD